MVSQAGEMLQRAWQQATAQAEDLVNDVEATPMERAAAWRRVGDSGLAAGAHAEASSAYHRSMACYESAIAEVGLSADQRDDRIELRDGLSWASADVTPYQARIGARVPFGVAQHTLDGVATLRFQQRLAHVAAASAAWSERTAEWERHWRDKCSGSSAGTATADLVVGWVLARATYWSGEYDRVGAYIRMAQEALPMMPSLQASSLPIDSRDEIESCVRGLAVLESRVTDRTRGGGAAAFEEALVSLDRRGKRRSLELAMLRLRAVILESPNGTEVVAFSRAFPQLAHMLEPSFDLID